MPIKMKRLKLLVLRPCVLKNLVLRCLVLQKMLHHFHSAS
jgi:hypothetical protein